MSSKTIPSSHVASTYTFPFSSNDKTNNLLATYYKQIEQLDVNKNPVKATDYIFRKILQETYEIFYNIKKEGTYRTHLGKMVISGTGAPYPVQIIANLLGPNVRVSCNPTDVRRTVGLAFLPKEMRKKEFISRGYGVVEVDITVQRETALRGSNPSVSLSSIASRLTPNFKIATVDLDSIVPEKSAWESFELLIMKCCKTSKGLCPFSLGDHIIFSGNVYWNEIAPYSNISAPLRNYLLKLELNFKENVFEAILRIVVGKDIGLANNLTLNELVEGRSFIEKYKLTDAGKILDTLLIKKMTAEDLSREEFNTLMEAISKDINTLPLANTILWILVTFIEDNFYDPNDSMKWKIDSFFSKVLFFNIKSKASWFCHKNAYLEACLDLVRCCPRLTCWLITFAELEMNEQSFFNFVEEYVTKKSDPFLIKLIKEYQQKTLKGEEFQQNLMKEYIPKTIPNLRELQTKYLEAIQLAILEESKPQLQERLYREMSKDEKVLSIISRRIQQEEMARREEAKNKAASMKSASAPNITPKFSADDEELLDGFEVVILGQTAQ